MSWDDVNGRWEKIPYDDDVATATTDQLRSEALDVVRKSRTFVVFGIDDDAATKGVHTVTVIAAPAEYDPDGNEPDDDTSCIESAMCEMMVRSYFDEVLSIDELKTVFDGIAVLMHRRQLISNVNACITRVLAAKGY